LGAAPERERQTDRQTDREREREGERGREREREGSTAGLSSKQAWKSRPAKSLVSPYHPLGKAKPDLMYLWSDKTATTSSYCEPSAAFARAKK